MWIMRCFIRRIGIRSDIVCSMVEEKLGEFLAAVCEAPKMLGGTQVAADEEQVTIDFTFATCVTIKAVKKGECFSKENRLIKRSRTGEILAEEYEAVLGRKAACDIETDVQLCRNMLA